MRTPSNPSISATSATSDVSAPTRRQARNGRQQIEAAFFLELRGALDQRGERDIDALLAGAEGDGVTAVARGEYLLPVVERRDDAVLAGSKPAAAAEQVD